MKNSLILLLILSLLLSCSSRTKQLEGNWYTCTSDGEYLEFFTKKDSFRIITDRGIATSWTHYRIEADTIYFIRPGEWSDSTKAILDYNPRKSLSMEFIDIDETTELKPLKSIVENTEDDYELLTGNKKRAISAECN